MLAKTICLVTILFLSCSCSNGCDMDKAMNKSLALGKIQGRLMADGGEGMESFGLQIMKESGVVSELIAQQKYDEACKKADEIAAKYKYDLDKEQQGMVTYEQLKADGGKGTGTCSVADAAKKQMELHSLLQEEVDAGRRTSDIFRTFNDDTRGYAEMLSTNPSKACELFEKLKEKYGVNKNAY